MKIAFVSILLLASFNVSLAEELPSHGPSSTGMPINSQGQTLNAANFFVPLNATTIPSRNPRWPEQLTFSEAPRMAADQVLERLNGEWEIRFQCDGRPLSSEYLQENGFADGWNSLHTEYTFQNGLLIRRVFRVRNGVVGNPINSEEISLNYWIERNMDSVDEFTVHKKEIDNPWTLKPIRIDETNEVIFRVESSRNSIGTCPGSSEKIEWLLIPKSIPQLV